MATFMLNIVHGTFIPKQMFTSPGFHCVKGYLMLQIVFASKFAVFLGLIQYTKRRDVANCDFEVSPASVPYDHGLTLRLQQQQAT